MYRRWQVRLYFGAKMHVWGKRTKKTSMWNISKKEYKLQKYFCYPWNSLMTKPQRVFIREKKSFRRGRIYGCVNPLSDAAGAKHFHLKVRFPWEGRLHLDYLMKKKREDRNWAPTFRTSLTNLPSYSQLDSEPGKMHRLRNWLFVDKCSDKFFREMFSNWSVPEQGFENFKVLLRTALS